MVLERTHHPFTLIMTRIRSRCESNKECISIGIAGRHTWQAAIMPKPGLCFRGNFVVPFVCKTYNEIWPASVCWSTICPKTTAKHVEANWFCWCSHPAVERLLSCRPWYSIGFQSWFIRWRKRGCLMPYQLCDENLLLTGCEQPIGHKRNNWIWLSPCEAVSSGFRELCYN